MDYGKVYVFDWRKDTGSLITPGGGLVKPMALNPSLQDFLGFALFIPQVKTWGYYKFVPSGTWDRKLGKACSFDKELSGEAEHNRKISS